MAVFTKPVVLFIYMYKYGCANVYLCTPVLYLSMYIIAYPVCVCM